MFRGIINKMCITYENPVQYSFIISDNIMNKMVEILSDKVFSINIASYEGLIEKFVKKGKSKDYY